MNIVQKRKLLASRRARMRGKSPLPRILLITGLLVAALGAISIAVAAGSTFAVYQHYSDDYVPIEEKLRQTNVGLTEVYDRNGMLLGSLSNPNAQLLNPVPLEEMSKWIIEATVSTEDDSFWENPGVNIRGLARAAWENYVSEDFGEGTGGSSITQQLIKNVYICPNITEDPNDPCVKDGAERTLDRKLREIVYALELEKDYTKEQILQWYLNQISYAGRYVGVQAAADGYFRKDAADLTLAEAAMLAGIPAAPTKYHPRLNCVTDADGACETDTVGRTVVIGDAKARQEEVLDLMVEHNRATPAEVAAAKAEPLLVYVADNPITPEAVAWIDNQVEPRLVRMCNAGVLPLIEGAEDCVESVHSAGYQVTSTLDLAETKIAQEMIRGFLQSGQAKNCNCYNAAIATIEPSTGQVLVYAPNQDPTYVSDPRVRGDVDQLVEINQPGSSFKPVVYLSWFDLLGKHPMSTFWDTNPIKVEETIIQNPANNSTGIITARAALGGSQNIAAFRAAVEVGVDNVIEMAKRMGVTTLEQGFDPTFSSHGDVGYGPSIATGGANLRAFDMAYVNATIANMGVMVGVEHYADELDIEEMNSTAFDEGADYDLALEQKLAFDRGNIRLPGTRELDPVTVLRVVDHDGNVVYDHETADDLRREQVVDPGSVWLLHSIMSDCNARFIIWGCGTSNTDLRLDAFSKSGERIPGGVKTGTQQGPLGINDTLETWVNGYSRDAGTSVWVGNSNNELVLDGTQSNFAAANTTLFLFKHWMAEYHDYLLRTGRISGLRTFAELQPANVAERPVQSPHTEKGAPSSCTTSTTGWIRTDIQYEPECESRQVDARNGLLAGDNTPSQFQVVRQFVRLPAFHPELALQLANARGIPVAPSQISAGQRSVSISSPVGGADISKTTPVVISVEVQGVTGWSVELTGATSQTIASGKEAVSNQTVGTIDPSSLPEGSYTLQLTVRSGSGQYGDSVSFTVKKSAASTPTPGTPAPGETATPTPEPGEPEPTQDPSEPTPQTPRPN